MTLVLLPGLDGTEILLRPLLAELPPSIRPVVVTYPASGPNDYATLLEHAREAIAGVPECWVLGWSFAGPLALMLAEAEPRRVRGVMLAATFVRSPTPVLPRLRFALASPTVWLWRVARRVPLQFRERADPLRRAKAETWRSVSARAIAKRLRAVAAVDAAALLQGCRQPLLYLASSRDRVVPARNADEVCRLRPDVQRVTIEGPHFALFTNPKAAAEAIAAFVGHHSVTPLLLDRAATA